MCQLPSKFADWSYMEDIHGQYCAIMEVYAKECTKNQVCKLFALTDGVVTWDMSVMP